MTNQQDIKETRQAILTNYTFESLRFKASRVQSLLEGLDEIWKKDYPKWLAEVQRSSLVRDKYHEKV